MSSAHTIRRPVRILLFSALRFSFHVASVVVKCTTSEPRKAPMALRSRSSVTASDTVVRNQTARLAASAASRYARSSARDRKTASLECPQPTPVIIARIGLEVQGHRLQAANLKGTGRDVGTDAGGIKLYRQADPCKRLDQTWQFMVRYPFAVFLFLALVPVAQAAVVSNNSTVHLCLLSTT